LLKKFIAVLSLVLVASSASANDGQGGASFDPNSYNSDKPLPKEVVNYIEREAAKGGELVGDIVEQFILGMGRRVPIKDKVMRKVIKQITGKSADSIGDAVGQAYTDHIAQKNIEKATEVYNQNQSD
jgi:hypothetical protein